MGSPGPTSLKGRGDTRLLYLRSARLVVVPEVECFRLPESSVFPAYPVVVARSVDRLASSTQDTII